MSDLMDVLYPKIQGPWLRNTEDGPNKNKLIPWAWSRPEFEALALIPWNWTEKIDGTNIRVIWDGYSVSFGGRTNKAQIPEELLKRLQTLFPEEIMEQKFQGRETILFGEGFGPKIQKGGGNYGSEVDFALFDVWVRGWWLEPQNVYDIAESLSLTAPQQYVGWDVYDAINVVKLGFTSAFSQEHEFLAEGLVGTAPCGILARDGSRIQMKVKAVDFYERD